jgi:spore maturation protein CgeB
VVKNVANYWLARSIIVNRNAMRVPVLPAWKRCLKNVFAKAQHKKINATKLMNYKKNITVIKHAVDSRVARFTDARWNVARPKMVQIPKESTSVSKCVERTSTAASTPVLSSVI